MNRFLAWLRLARVSNLPTAWSNILMGFAMAGGGGAGELLLLVAASSCLYLAGMILNDVFDLAEDRLHRPERVLPTGRIHVSRARLAGFMCLAGGVMLALIAGWMGGPSGGGTGWLAFKQPVFLTAVALAILIMVYDGGGKAAWFGPLLMGGCRALNVLLGASPGKPQLLWAGHDPTHWYVALCVGCFVAGITWFARQEHTRSGRQNLIGGAVLMLIAVAALLFLPCSQGMLSGVSVEVTPANRQLFCLILVVVLFPAARRVGAAIRHPDAARVQRAVVVCLGSLVMIDAALVWLFVPDQPALAAGVALLLVPVILLGRVIRAT